MSYVYKHQPSSERPAAHRLQRHHAASDPATPPALLEPDQRSFQRRPLAAYGNRRPRCGYQQTTRLVQQNRSPFLVLNEPHRGPQPRPAQALLASRSAVQTICSNQGATGQQARRIQVYPDRTQKLAIATWLTASRWTYNLTVEILQSGIPAVWKHSASMVMPEVKALHPEWDSVPYQVKRTAVRDACRAMSNIKTFNLELKADQAHGNRTDEEFAQSATAAGRTPGSPATYQTTP